MHSTTSNDSRMPSGRSAASSRASAKPAPPSRKPPSRSSSARSSRYRRRVVTSLLLILVLVLLLAGGIAFSLGTSKAFSAPGATVTLTPRSSLEQQSITIQAVTGTPHRGQVQARLLTSTQTSRSTVAATGSGQQDALAASGQVTFYNLATYSIAIPAGVQLTGRDGVQIVTDAAAQVPAGNPPTMGSASVPAHAVHTGQSGNIAAGDIDALCCANGIVAKNQQAFGGGQNARSFTVVAQTDIDSVSAQLAGQLSQQAQTGLSTQVRAGEKLYATPCTTKVQSEPAVGHDAKQVTVSVSVTCGGATYTLGQVDSLASALFQQQEQAALGSHYALDGQVAASVQQAGITQPQPGTLAIPVEVRALWVYQVDRSGFRALVKQLAGKEPAAARAVLLRFPGVAQASIQLSGWNASTLPTDINQIVIVVAGVTRP